MTKILKGVDEINIIINDFLKPFGCTSEMALDFGYWYDSHIINWSLFVSETSDTTFKRFVEKEFPDITADIFLWSLLHEVGHHETCQKWSDEEQFDFDRQKEELENENSDKEFTIACMEYYYISDEYDASEWAANFMRNNELDVKEFWNKLQEAIMNFYDVNNIE